MSSPLRSQADELDLPQLVNGIADSFAADTALVDATEWIEIEPEAARIIDPKCADVEIIHETKSRTQNWERPPI
jgi:hypothetical protein